MEIIRDRHFQYCHFCKKLFYVSDKSSYINKGWEGNKPVWFCSLTHKKKWEKKKYEKRKNTNKCDKKSLKET